MLVVAALGGNALSPRGENPSSDLLVSNVELVADALVPLATRHELVITHGNGPQVGLLALQSAAIEEVAPYPLDILNAESDGMIGYLVERELRERLPGREVATLLTMVVVDPEDEAFDAPTKPIGAVYPAEDAEILRAKHGWDLAPDGGGVRRVVPSPQPLEIPGLPTIRLLLDSGVIVVCGGGGGIPIVADDVGWSGAEAVIDKDRISEKLATELNADALLLLTDVPAVMEGYGSADPRQIREATVRELEAMDLDAGSMGPKVEAACRFVQATGGVAGIGQLGDAVAILEGTAGTRITA